MAEESVLFLCYGTIVTKMEWILKVQIYWPVLAPTLVDGIEATKVGFLRRVVGFALAGGLMFDRSSWKGQMIPVPVRSPSQRWWTWPGKDKHLKTDNNPVLFASMD